MAIASNTFSVSDLVAKAAVKSLRNSFILASRCTSNVASTFGMNGFKGGDTVRIKLPPRYISATGAAIQKNNTVNSTVPITLVQRNIGIGAITKDMTLSIDSLMQFVDPIMAQLASDIDSDGFALYYKAQNLTTPGAYSAGSPAAWTGADLATLRPFLDAKARLREKGMPTDDRAYVAVTPAQSAGIVDGLKSLFQDATQVAEQYKRGLMGIAAGFQWLESQTMPTHTNGTRALGAGAAIDGAQTGSSLLLKSVGNAVTITRGDQFTVAGVYAINPLTRVATNKLQVFTVQTATTSSAGGAATVSVVPAINVTSPGQTVSAGAADSAAVLWMGAASASTEVALAWHKDGMYVAFFDLDSNLPGAEAGKATDPTTGMTVRVAKQYNAETDEVVFRADVLYGFSVVRGELMSRVQG